MQVNFTERLGDSYGACPYCDARPVTAFNLKYVRSHLDRALQDLLANLDKPVPLKHGVLRRCPQCGQSWYIDDEGIFATRVPRDRETILAQWSERPLDIRGHFDVLASIVPSKPIASEMGAGISCATRRADEQRMGYAPTEVEDAAGHTFILNWSADVFDHDGIRGKDIRLPFRRWTAKELPPILGEPRDRITYVYADYIRDASRLAARCPG